MRLNKAKYISTLLNRPFKDILQELYQHKQLSSSDQIDHVVPVVKNGTNEVDNLRTLCRECNNGKMLSEEKYV